MAERNHNNTYLPRDEATRLEDGAATVTVSRNGQVGGSDRILDLGDDAFDAVEGHAAFLRGEIVFDLSTFDFTTGDEFVEAVVQLSLKADFADSIIERERIRFGVAKDGADIDLPAATDGSVRIVMPVDNEVNEIRYRYMRLRFISGGTTPIATIDAFFTKQLQLAG